MSSTNGYSDEEVNEGIAEDTTEEELIETNREEYDDAPVNFRFLLMSFSSLGFSYFENRPIWNLSVSKQNLRFNDFMYKSST